MDLGLILSSTTAALGNLFPPLEASVAKKKERERLLIRFSLIPLPALKFYDLDTYFMKCNLSFISLFSPLRKDFSTFSHLRYLGC